MNLLDHFRRQFTYDDWANRESIASLRKNESASHFAFKVMSHIIATERVWLARLESRPNPEVWPEWTLEETDRHRAENSGQWQQYLDASLPPNWKKRFLIAIPRANPSAAWCRT